MKYTEMTMVGFKKEVRTMNNTSYTMTALIAMWRYYKDLPLDFRVEEIEKWSELKEREIKLIAKFGYIDEDLMARKNLVIKLGNGGLLYRK